MASTKQFTTLGQEEVILRISADECATLLPNKVVEVTKGDCMRQIEAAQASLKTLSVDAYSDEVHSTHWAESFQTNYSMAGDMETQFYALVETVNQDDVSPQKVRESLQEIKKLHSSTKETCELTREALCSAYSLSTMEGPQFRSLPVGFERLTQGDSTLRSSIDGMMDDYEGYVGLTGELQSKVAECAEKSQEISARAKKGLSDTQALAGVFTVDRTLTRDKVLTSMQSLQKIRDDLCLSLQDQRKEWQYEMDCAFSTWKKQGKKDSDC